MKISRAELRSIIREEINRTALNELFNGYEEAKAQLPYVEGELENIEMSAMSMGGHNRTSAAAYREYSEKLEQLKLDIKNGGPYTLRGKVPDFEAFLDWYEDGNAYRQYNGDMSFLTKDSGWRKKIHGGWKALYKYWAKTFR